MLKEFKEFAMKGNMLDMATGIVIGAAFGAIIKSLVADVIMPPIGMLLYVITGVSDITLGEILKDLWPFLIAIFLVLLLITYVPAITLFLPRMLAGG